MLPGVEEFIREHHEGGSFDPQIQSAFRMIERMREQREQRHAAMNWWTPLPPAVAIAYAELRRWRGMTQSANLTKLGIRLLSRACKAHGWDDDRILRLIIEAISLGNDDAKRDGLIS
jgi:hypothetical protein